MRNKFFILLFLFITTDLYSQKVVNYQISGYVHNMQSAYFDSINRNWINDNLIHSRLNFQLSYQNKLTFNVSLRSRIFTGETVKSFPGYADFVKQDPGLLQLSSNPISKNSVLLNTAIDRLNIHYYGNNFELTLGRQRINWAKTFVWNPNDLFNNYSFFDVDYPERPGSDALDFIYYISPMTNIEMASKLDKDTNLTAALKFSTTIGSYDLQLITGILRQQDYAIGLGWTGYIGNITFRGEATYLQPKENFADTLGCLIFSTGLDYSFGKSNSIMLEFLYNQRKDKYLLTNPMDLYSAPMDIKHLSFSQYNIFAQIMTQPHPLVMLSMAGMYFPKEKGFFLMPNMTYSLSDNADISLITQIFQGKFETPWGGTNKFRFNAIFIRLSLNFGSK